MIAHDIIEETDGDLKISNGDLVVGESDNQHIRDLIEGAPGWWKQFPLAGLNPYKYYNSKNSEQTVKNDVKKQLTQDGYVDIVADISIESNGKLTGQINATRK